MRQRRRAARAMLVIAVVAAALGVEVSLGSTADAASEEPLPAPYIVGGAPAANPGYVAVLLRSWVSSAEDANFCGGSLVRVDVVMTAAHCVDDLDPGDLDVAVGFSQLSLIGPGDRLEVTEIAIHPDWVPDEVLPTDIALLRLAEPTSGLPVVAMEQDPLEPSPPRPLVIVGWGYIDEDRTEMTDPMQSADSVTRTAVDDPDWWGNALCLLDDTADDFCNGGATTGTCQGDSGGPILAETASGSGVMEVVGIVSFGPSTQCLHPSYYDGGQRISPYRPWIGTTLSSWNEPPELTADRATVAVREGHTAMNTGTFHDREDTDVTVTASIGAITQDTGGSGTWSWSYDTRDGPSDSRTVTITGSDPTEGVTTFELTVSNTAPSVSAVPTRTVDLGSGPEIDLATFADPGRADTHTATVDWGDGTDLRPATVTGSAGTGTVRGAPRYTETGFHRVTVCVSDDEGASGCAAADHTVVADTSCPDPVLPFGDVPLSSFAVGDVGCIYGLGITTGTSATTYDPFGFVTREQMAAFIGRLLQAV